MPPRSQSRKPFMMKVKMPSVRMFIGSVRMMRIGFTVMPISPQRSARTSAVTNEATEIPGTIYGRARNANALITHLRSSIGISVKCFQYTIKNLPLPGDSLLRVAAAAQERACGLETDLDIQPERPILDIEDIQAVLILEGEVRAAGYLGHAGNSRLDGEQTPVILRIAVHCAFLVRTRTDQTHIAAQDIKELRQLIQRGALDKSSDTHAARVVLDLVEDAALAHVALFDQLLLEGDRFLQLRILLGDAVAPLHIAEFVDEKLLAVLADALVLVDDRAVRVLELDEKSDQEHQGREEERQPEAGDDIERALQYPSPAIERRVLVFDDGLAAEDPHREAGRLERRRNVFVSDVVDLAVVEKLFQLVIGQAGIADDDLVYAFGFADLLDMRDARVIDLVHHLVAQAPVALEFLLDGVHLFARTDEEHAMGADAFVLQEPLLDLLDRQPGQSDIQDAEAPAEEDHEARREPLAVQEDSDDEDDEGKSGRLAHAVEFRPEAPRHPHGVEAFDSENDDEKRQEVCDRTDVL